MQEFLEPTSPKMFGNVIDNEVLKTNLMNAFEELNDILVHHSGPFASNCVIGSKWRQVNDIDEFTKDGIKILKHLVVSEDPSARFAARMARFVGITVDSRCHDGTTTSMLLFCRLAFIALEKMDQTWFEQDRYILTKSLTNLLNKCLDYLEQIKITEEELFSLCKDFDIDTTLEDVRAGIAYHMAMISSKGDRGLSTKIAAVIRSCPKKIYGMFKDTPLAVETEEPYILKKQDYDLGIRANLGNMQDYNYRNDTQYMTENAVIFATGNEIINDSHESLFLSSFISTNPRIRANLIEYGESKGWEDFHEGKKNLIIISPLLNDPGLITEINLFNAKNPDVKISWFNVHVNGRMRTSLNKTIHYMAGVPLFTDVMMVNPVMSFVGLQETNVKVHLIGSTLTISNIYEKDGEVYHPLFREPDLFQPYTDFASETESLIEFARENITNPALDQDEVTYLTSLYRSLTTQEIYDIEIGGSSHDQYANRTVYEDAIGAALSAVNEGFVLGGYGQLAKFMYEDIASFSNLQKLTIDNYLVNEFFKAFVSIVEDSLRVPEDNPLVRDLIVDNPKSKLSFIVADTNNYVENATPDKYIKNQVLDKLMLKNFLDFSNDKVILFQAFGGFHEQFRRFRDILPKLANTTHLADMRIKEGTDVR